MRGTVSQFVKVKQGLCHVRLEHPRRVRASTIWRGKRGGADGSSTLYASVNAVATSCYPPSTAAVGSRLA